MNTTFSMGATHNTILEQKNEESFVHYVHLLRLAHYNSWQEIA